MAHYRGILYLVVWWEPFSKRWITTTHYTYTGVEWRELRALSKSDTTGIYEASSDNRPVQMEALIKKSKGKESNFVKVIKHRSPHHILPCQSMNF